MTAIEFNQLEESTRAATVSDLGILIEERMVGKSQVKIYSMKDFFVEMWIDFKNSKIQKVHALDNEPDWSSYLDEMDL